MIAAWIVVSAVMFVVLVLVTAVQLCYLELLRLRPRENEMLVYFDSEIEDYLNVKRDVGALAFSIWKHTLLAMIAIPIMAITNILLEAAIFSFLLMITGAYLLPQWMYRRTSGRWLGGIRPVLRGMIFAARPVISMLSVMKTIAELAEEDAPPAEKNDEIHALIDASAEEGIIRENDKKLLRTVIELKDKTVREVMTPRPNMVTIAEAKTLEDLRQIVISEQYSRIPVYQESLDNIVGFVHVRDMFEVESQQRLLRKVREIMRPIDSVPETKPVDALLREMQRDGKHMVMVVDEYGNTAGLATMEDLVEELLGEIRDEHEPAVDVENQGDGTYIVSGSYDLDHLPDLVEFRPPESTESTTIGGLVTEWMGHVPHQGESIERDGLRIEVLAASDLRVDRVRLSRVLNGAGNGEAEKSSGHGEAAHVES